MKHPALARVFSVVLAILALIEAAVGVRGLQKNEQERAERDSYAARFEGRIESYRTLHAELAAHPDYQKTVKALDTFTAAHEKAAGRHKTETAIYTATKGGLKMGEDLILAGREELKETREQLQDPETRRILIETMVGQMLASQDAVMAEINRMAASAGTQANTCYAESAKYRAEAARFRALLETEPQPPAEPAAAPEPQPPAEPEAPLPPEKPAEPVAPTEPTLQIPDLPDASEEELAAAAQEAQARYEAELAEYEQALALYRQALELYEQTLAAADTQEEAYRNALAAWETEHAEWENLMAAWELEHAAWETDAPNREAEHAAWEIAYSDWETAHAAWEESCQTFKAESLTQESINILEALGSALSEAAATAAQKLAELSNTTGESYPELEELIARGAETAEQIRQLAQVYAAGLSNEQFLNLCEELAQYAQYLGDGFSTIAVSLENPAHTITELAELLGITEDLAGLLNTQLDRAEHQLQAALEEMWYQAGELKKNELKLEAQKHGLDSEAKVLAERREDADSLKDLQNRHSAARLVLTNVPEIKSRMTDEESIPAAAEAYLRSYREQTETLFRKKQLMNWLAIAGGAMGALGIPAAFELIKKRFWLLAPVLLCLGCSAAADAISLQLGIRQLYVALVTAIFALIQLLIVLPRRKRPAHLS